LRRRPPGRPHRLRVVRQHAQGVGRVEWSVPDAERAHGLSAAPASTRHIDRVDCSSTPRGAQVYCVAVLSNDRVVSGSSDNRLKVWNVLTGDCRQTLSGHTSSARRRRPVEPCGDCSSTPRGAGPVRRRPAERPRRVWVARPHAQGVGRLERSVPPHAERAHGLSAAPASSRHNASIARRRREGAGRVRRRPVERQRRVRVARQHAQGVGRVERRVPPDAARAHRQSAVPASTRTARLIALDAARGAGPMRRSAVERQRRLRVVGRHAQGVERLERSVPRDAERWAHERSAVPASRRIARSIARRRRDGRRSVASSSCRTATSFLGVDMATTRSRCGTCRAASASGR
jgi:hypothetical protein